jgi:hypothetical protein
MLSMSHLGMLLVSSILAAGLFVDEPPPAWQPRIEALIRQLGDASFTKRDAATKALLAEDEKIVPLLDKAKKGADLEISRRIDRIRYQVYGYTEDLTTFLSGPAFNDAAARPRQPIELLLRGEPLDPLPGIRSLVAAHQPKSGDFLLKIIADPNHNLHEPATRLFCETWSSGSAEQLQKYLQTSFYLKAIHRTRYPQGVDAYIETRYWNRYGWTGWPKELSWQTRITHWLDGKPYGKSFVYNYPGGGASTGWINAGKLELGDHVMCFEVEYTINHRAGKHQEKARSPEFAFAVVPAVLADDLIALTDAALAKQIREALHMLDYQGQDGREKVPSPWQPQITWEEPKGITRGLHVPVWVVKEPLIVDLCFDVTIRNVKTGKSYPGDPLVLHKGKTGRGNFSPRDARAFCAEHDGFLEVEIGLQPSRSVALTDPEITSYFGWPITSPTLRAKIIDDADRKKSD